MGRASESSPTIPSTFCAPLATSQAGVAAVAAKSDFRILILKRLENAFRFDLFKKAAQRIP
jgi:hypothetical protein